VITRANAAGGNTVRSSTKIKAAGGYMTMGGYQTVGFTVIESPNIFKYVLTPTLTNTKKREQAKVLRRLLLGAAHLPTDVAQ
jgi:hypothetical protein